jgi:Domain of unknown function (DUF4136)
MKKKFSYLVPAALLFAASLAAKITTDYKHQTDFSKYHTYSWIGVRAGNQLWQDRIQNAVDNALSQKGWMKVPSGGDASVSAFGRTREQDTLETFYDGFPGWGWRWGGGFGTATTTVEPQEIGTLTVDIFDGQTKQLVWRGVSSKTLSSSPEKNDKRLEKSVDDMFKKFPPPEKG